MSIYSFEEATAELSIPPFSAQRALAAVGVRIPLPGWRELPIEVRRRFATEGAKGALDIDAVNQLCSRASTKHIILVPRERDPDPDEVPADLAQSLGPTQRLSVSAWRGLRTLDRYVLRRLASNPRLLAKACREIFNETSSGSAASPCAFGHCELRINKEAAAQLKAGTVLNGRAFILARTAGVRAARRAPELLDLQAEKMTGPIELDHSLNPHAASAGPCVLWQAHVSTWDGEFYPAASELAATTAAIALQDMIRSIDPRATIFTAGVYETPWQVGDPQSLSEDATIFARSKP